MDPIVFTESSKVWKQMARNVRSLDYQLELEIHKQLLSFFQVGDYYYWIFNIKEQAFDFVSKEVQHMLGYSPEEMDVPFFLGKIHPEDQPWFVSFETKVQQFFVTLTTGQVPNYKVRYDYRVQKKDGSYIRILQQVVTIQFDDHGLLRTFGVHTDITHLKPEGMPLLSFIGMNGEPSYINVEVEKAMLPEANPLTQRERQVLSLLIEGRSSKQISNLLFISQHTVLTHRKNMLAKTGCHNTASLVSHAIQKGLI